tara:strand:+ start:879 stop:1493 length:615 start_codon:yes stop_codon:yes gene_type:complete
MSQIKLLHSGGNGVSIVAPDSNPASDRTLKLPSDGDGTILTTNSSVGKILQIVQIAKTDTASTTSTTFGDVSGLSQAITTVAGSKVLCLGNVFFGSSAAYSTWFRLVRVDVDGSTNYPWLGDADSTVTRASAGTYTGYYNYQAENHSFTCLDTPSGAGTHTYKIQWKQGYSGGYTSYIGRDAGGSTDASRGRVPSSITLIEVAA